MIANFTLLLSPEPFVMIDQQYGMVIRSDLLSTQQPNTGEITLVSCVCFFQLTRCLQRVNMCLLLCTSSTMRLCTGTLERIFTWRSAVVLLGKTTRY